MFKRYKPSPILSISLWIYIILGKWPLSVINRDLIIVAAGGVQ